MDYNHRREILLAIDQYGYSYEETGEVARIMARKHGDQSFKEGETPNLADELADLLWVTIAIANQEGIDLTEALQRNIEKKTSRDKNRHLNNPKLK